jgi:hypothetical protein
MSDRTTIMRAFNNHFIELLDDIISIYPENVEILTAKKSFETFRKMNPVVIIKAWHLYVYLPYSKYIEEGDLSFFFDKDYSSDLDSVANQDEVLKMIERVRTPFKQLSETDKEQTKKYLKNLNKLAVAYSQI